MDTNEILRKMLADGIRPKQLAEFVNCDTTNDNDINAVTNESAKKVLNALYGLKYNVK